MRPTNHCSSPQAGGHKQICRLTSRIVLAVLIGSLCPSTVFAGTVRDYAVFAGHQVTFTSSMNVFDAPLGRLGSNGDISFASATIRLTAVEAAGSMLGNPSFLNVQNDLVFNGGIQFGGLSNVLGSADVGGTAIVNADLHGNLTAFGDVTIGGTVYGDVRSDNSVSLATFGEVVRNVYANRDVVLANSSTIGGNVTYGNQLTLGTFATIGGSRTKGTTQVNPAHFVPIPIVADSFSTGGPNIAVNTFETKTIAPGQYGNLTINGATIKLSPGQYYFDSVIASSSFMTLDLNLSSPGDIEIVVKGNYDIPLQVVQVNGVDAASVKPQLARRVFVESLGNIHVGWDNLGTLFAPDGDIRLDSLTDVWGATIAGHDAIFGGGAHVDYVQSNHFPVPELGSGWLLATSALLLARSLAKRQRRFS